MKTDVICIGAAIVDILVQPCSEKVFQVGSYPCDEISMSAGGDALNEASILSKMGHNVELISIFGKDDAGYHLKNYCERHNIFVRPSCFKKEIKTGINTVLIKEDGSRHFLTNQNGSLRQLTLDDIPFDFKGKILSFGSIFVFPYLKDEELSSIFKIAKHRDMIVCADMTKCKNKETISDLKKTLPYIDYIFPNDEEAMLFTRTDSVEAAANALYLAGVNNVVITCGKKGCYVKNFELDEYIYPKEEVNCIDTTGAGDSFVAGFIHSLLQNKSIEECCEYANICGGKNIQYVGATTWIKGE